MATFLILALKPAGRMPPPEKDFQKGLIGGDAVEGVQATPWG
jgi:hypothetical protein